MKSNNLKWPCIAIENNKGAYINPWEVYGNKYASTEITVPLTVTSWAKTARSDKEFRMRSTKNKENFDSKNGAYSSKDSTDSSRYERISFRINFDIENTIRIQICHFKLTQSIILNKSKLMIEIEELRKSL